MRRIVIATLLSLGICISFLRAPVQQTLASPAVAAVSQPALSFTVLAQHHQKEPHLLRATQTLYTVHPGDTLSAIAKRFYRNPRAWTVIYWKNHGHIRWANVITPGETLVIPPLPAVLPAAPAALAPVSITYVPRSQSSQSYSPVAVQSISTGPWPGGAFGACVVERESGGNAQVMNSTGHYGLYQFSLGTWEAYGGSAALFGRATVAYQEQIFMNALARGGESNWSAYDGC